MRILGEDRGSGSVKVLIETDEDIWHLYNVIEVGDLVTASTTRREEKSADKIRAERAEKKRMTLGVRMEKIEFSEEDLRLKLLGTIETGPQDIGQHHTLILETGDSLTIAKTHWRETQLERLQRAVSDSKKPRIVFVSLDQDEATIAVLRQFGLKEVVTIRSGRSGKQYAEKPSADGYHAEIAAKLAPLMEPNMPLVLLGPGFEKETLSEDLKKADPSAFGRMYVYHTGQCGMAGINELLKGGMGADVLRDSAVGTEIEAVERLMAEISKPNGLGTYGTQEVMDAAMAGAVDTLLVLDSKVREQDMDDVVRAVESQKGSVIVVSGQHDGGRALASLGGMGAILRYRLRRLAELIYRAFIWRVSEGRANAGMDHSDGMHMKTKSEVVERLNAPLCICDSTLGAGEQAAGVVFSNIEKYRIAQHLDNAGVPQLEVGNPMVGTEEKTAVKHIAHMGLSASVMSTNRADIADINASIECDVDAVSISLPTSQLQMAEILGKDSNWVLDKVFEAASYAAQHGLYICCVAEDASRADLGFLIEYAKAAKDAGADRFGYADSIGVEDPFTCNERIRMLKQISGMDVEIITRNDFGMATANTVAAVKAGARFARVTAMGIGPRAGCAPLEEVVMASKHVLGMDTGVDTAKLRPVAESVSVASGISIWPSKPIIGSKCFAQETGFVNNPAVTEPYDPAEVGTERSLVIGKHSVRNTIVAAMSDMGIEISRNDAENLLVLVRKASSQMHRCLNQSELFLLYEDMMSGNNTFDDVPVQDASVQ